MAMATNSLRENINTYIKHLEGRVHDLVELKVENTNAMYKCAESIGMDGSATARQISAYANSVKEAQEKIDATKSVINALKYILELSKED